MLPSAIEGGDAHLKDFAVTYEHAESPVRLAPAYDLVSTTVYQPRNVMALRLAGSNAFPDRRQPMAFGRQTCGLPEGAVRRVLERAEHGVRETQSRIRRFVSRHRDFSGTGERLLAAYEWGLRRLSTRNP